MGFELGSFSFSFACSFKDLTEDLSEQGQQYFARPILITSCNSLSFLATTLFSPSFSKRNLSLPSFKSSVCLVSCATLLCDSLSCCLVFSRALRALITPNWRSANTFVVPPGVSEYLLFGDAGVCKDDEEVSAVAALNDVDVVGVDSDGWSFEERGAGRDVAPSSARARALPESQFV